MKACPRCNWADAWRLGDGRHKCQSCGWRYSWRPVWDALRLPEADKHSLLRAFLGEPDNLERIAPAQRQRFFRLVRASCALQNPVAYESIYIQGCVASSAGRSRMRGWATAREVMIFGIAEQAGAVSICAPSISPLHVLGLLRAQSALGGVLCVSDDFGYASLPIHSDFVSIPRVTRGLLSTRPIERFWHRARTELQEHRRISLRQWPLYLGELCFRFNRRHQDLEPVLRELLQSTDVGDVRMFLDTTLAWTRDQDPATAQEHDEPALSGRAVRSPFITGMSL